MPVSSSTARHAAYNDTPSKIPFPLAYNSPAPLDSKIASKIMRLNSRRGSASSASSLPRRLASKSLTNLAARRADDEALTAAASSGGEVSTPAKQRSPFRHLAGRTSIGSPGELDRVFHDDITMRTATSFASPAPSMGSPFVPRPRQASEEDEVTDLPPTSIPIPSFVYRPDATPAKWNPEDPDAPSPFIRRGSSSGSASSAGSAPSQPVFSSGSSGSGPAAAPSSSGASSVPGSAASSTGGSTRPSSRGERAPLSSINPQPSAPAATTSAAPRKLPRSRSGNLSSLHQTVLARNAARTELGGAVRTRAVVGRDPSRC